MPLMGNHFMSNWDSGSYKGAYVLKSLTGKSFLTIAEPKHKDFVQKIVEEILNGNTNLARKFNISQVILHHDLKFRNNEYENYIYASNRLDILGYKVIIDNDYFTLYDLTQTFIEKETKKFEVFSNLYVLNSHNADSSKYIFEYEKQKNDVINFVMKEHLKNKKVKPTRMFGRVFSLPKILTNDTIIPNLDREDLMFNSGKLMTLDGGKMLYCKMDNSQIDLFLKKQDIHLSFKGKRADIVFDEELVLIQSLDFHNQMNYFFNLKNNVVFCGESLNLIGSAQNELHLYEINNENKDEWVIFSGIDKTGNVSDCNRYDDNPQIELNILKDQSGDHVLQLSAKRHFACLYEKISVEDEATYLIEFDHRSPTNSFAGYNVTFLGNNTHLFDKQIDSNEKWKTYRKLITVPQDVSSILFYNYAFESDRIKKNIVEYRNVRIVQLPSVVKNIVYESDELQNYERPDEIEVRQNLLSRKKILIRGVRTPFYLAMSESYHNQWKALMNNKKVTGFFNNWLPWICPDEIDDNKHFRVNGYANGWFVEPAQLCDNNTACTLNPDGIYDMEMIVEFWPQRWFYLGLLISGTTFWGVYWVFGMGNGWENSCSFKR